jgi:hypothetical protein
MLSSPARWPRTRPDEVNETEESGIVQQQNQQPASEEFLHSLIRAIPEGAKQVLRGNDFERAFNSCHEMLEASSEKARANKDGVIQYEILTRDECVRYAALAVEPIWRYYHGPPQDAVTEALTLVAAGAPLDSVPASLRQQQGKARSALSKEAGKAGLRPLWAIPFVLLSFVIGSSVTALVVILVGGAVVAILPESQYGTLSFILQFLAIPALVIAGGVAAVNFTIKVAVRRSSRSALTRHPEAVPSGNAAKAAYDLLWLMFV